MAADLQQPRFDVLDLWSAPDGIAAEVAFDAGVELAPSAVWRLDLPAGPDPTQARLQAAQTSLDSIAAALIQAGPRLQHLAAVESAASDLAFDPLAPVQLLAAEQELLAMLRDFEVNASMTSFGPLDRIQRPLPGTKPAPGCSACWDRLSSSSPTLPGSRPQSKASSSAARPSTGWAACAPCGRGASNPQSSVVTTSPCACPWPPARPPSASSP